MLKNGDVSNLLYETSSAMACYYEDHLDIRHMAAIIIHNAIEIEKLKDKIKY